MDIKDRHAISKSLRKGESVYIISESEEFVARFAYVGKDLMCYPKGKGRKAKEFKYKENPYLQDALELGEPITKEDYERF